MQGLLNMDRATEDVSSLQRLQDKLQVHVRSLESLGVKGDNYGVILTPLLLSRLPKDICLVWARDSVGKEGDLVFLLEVLKAEVNSRVKSGVYSGLSAAGEKPTTASGVKTRPVDRDSGRRKRLQQPRSGAALQAASPGAGAGCEFCSGPHRATECPDFLSLSVSERQDKVRGANLCFVCLKGGHRARHCLEKCAHCKGRHNVLCCYKHVFDFAHKGVKASDAVSSDSAHVGSGSRPAATASLSCVPPVQCSVLPTARVFVKGSKGVVEATLMFDTGSDCSYVSQSLVKRVGATSIRTERNTYCAFGGGKSAIAERQLYEMEVCRSQYGQAGCSLFDGYGGSCDLFPFATSAGATGGGSLLR